MRTSWMVALVLVAIAAGCADRAPTGTEASEASTHDDQGTPASAAELTSEPLPPIFVYELTKARHEFTDPLAMKIRLKPKGRSAQVVNLGDPSRMAVVKIIVQPGARFPWHTHPGPVLVAVKRGELVYVYADDCVERSYPVKTALVDPGSNVHYAFNPTQGETVLIATFLDVPATGALTIPVDAATSTALDAKCGVAPAAAHAH